MQYTDIAGRHFIAVGCGAGIYVSERGTKGALLVISGQDVLYSNELWAFVSLNSEWRKAINISYPERLAALPDHNKFLVHHEYGLTAYSLDILGRIALGRSGINVNATMENIAGTDGYVVFFRVMRISHRSMGERRYFILFSEHELMRYRSALCIQRFYANHISLARGCITRNKKRFWA